MNEKKAKAIRRMINKVAPDFASLGYVQKPKGVITVAPRTKRALVKGAKKTARGR